MAQTLGSLAIGTLVKLNESGKPVEFYVTQHNYQSSLNGTGRTLLTRSSVVNTKNRWNSSNVNAWGNSYLLSYLNDTYKSFFDSDIQEAMGATSYPYTIGDGYSTVSNRADSIFILSITELGLHNDYGSAEGTAVPIADDIRIAYTESRHTVDYWTRSPDTRVTTRALYVNDEGAGPVFSNCTNNGPYTRPSFTLPASTLVDDDGNVYPFPIPILTAPTAVMQSQTTDISWSQVAEADSYILQRLTDSGSWTTIYTGPNLTYTDTIGNWSTVQYRVRAGLDGSYGDYNTSSVIQVLPASNLLISGTDGNLGTITSDVTFSILTDTGNQFTYTVTVNDSQWYTGQATSYNGVLSIMELPTSTGTIVISASVMTSAGQVSVDRNWTYTKAAVTFPSVAQIGTLQYENVDFLPTTLAELVRTNPYWGGSLDSALEMLKEAVTGRVKIETGSYVGTGQYGSSHPNQLSFEFEPKAVFIYWISSGNANNAIAALFPEGAVAYRSAGGNGQWFYTDVLNATFGSNDISWYGSGIDAQMNRNAIRYGYVALG